MNLSSGFLENVLILLLGAAVTGFLVPYVLKRIDDRKMLEQQRFQAELARQDKVIDAQVTLLDTLATLLWEYQRFAMEVLYYQQPGTANPELYATAARAYEENSGAVLTQIRAEISKMLRLAPQSLYEDLSELFYGELAPFDECLVGLIRATETAAGTAGSEARCAAASGRFASTSWAELLAYGDRPLPERVDRAIDGLADALGLKWQGAPTKGDGASG